MYFFFDCSLLMINLNGSMIWVCPVTEERDYYNYQINYVPRDKVVEVVWLREELEKIGNNDEYITAEDLAKFLKGIMDMIDPYSVEVTVWDDSMGIQLEVKI